MIEAKLFAYKLLEELREDLLFLDPSSAAVPNTTVEACVVAKADGVVAGIEEAVEFLRLLGFELLKAVEDGAQVAKGDEVLCFTGPARDVLKVERTLLNLLIHASGIATYTRRVVEKVKAVNPKCRVAATRKTLPFLRYIEKKAVWIGGGDPHRLSLSHGVIYKDNHKALVSLGELAKAEVPLMAKREVEVSSAEEAVEAAKLGFEIIMLDNVTPEEAARAHQMLQALGLRERVVLEASGGIDENTAPLYAPYVDVVSMGKLTHSAPALDMSLEIRPAKARVGIIGFGTLGKEVAKLVEQDLGMELVAVYDVDAERCREAGPKCVRDVEELIQRAQYVVEAASADAVLQYACRILEKGRHLVVASVGALTKLNCKKQRGIIFVPSGAIAGLDLAAAVGGRIRHRAVKGVVDQETRGVAEELYWRYPRNLNASVALALASRSRVEVEIGGGAPPSVNVHEIEVEHQWGRAYIRLENRAVGPSSLVAARSIYRTLKSAVLMATGKAKVVVGTFAAYDQLVPSSSQLG